MSNTNIQKRIDEINERIEAIYDHDGIELRSSYYANFDYCLDSVTFERIDNETLETIKEYTVTLLDTDEPEIEWNTDTDGGYGCWSRLNKEVRDLVVELYQLNKELEFLEELLELDDYVEEELKPVAEAKTLNRGLCDKWETVRVKVTYYEKRVHIVQWVKCECIHRVYSVWRDRCRQFEIEGGEYAINHDDDFISCGCNDDYAESVYKFMLL